MYSMVSEIIYVLSVFKTIILSLIVAIDRLISLYRMMNWIPYSNFLLGVKSDNWNITVKKKQRCTLSYETRRERRYYSNSNLIVVLHLTRQTRRPCLMGCVGARATAERGIIINCFIQLWKMEWFVGQNSVSLHFLDRGWGPLSLPPIHPRMLFNNNILLFLNSIMFSLSFLHCVIAYSYFGYARKLTNNIEE